MASEKSPLKMASGKSPRAGVDTLKNCKDPTLFSRTLDLGELFLDVVPEEKESLTKFNLFSHEEHNLFVEHHLLSDWESLCWREVGRWIKYEETMEEHGNHWAKPRIPALNFHSMVNLRRIMEPGLILLDLEASDMDSVSAAILDGLEDKGLLDKSDLNAVRKTLMVKHRHVEDSEKVWNYLEHELNLGRTSTIEVGGGSGSFTLEDIKGARKLSRLIRRLPEEAQAALILSGVHPSMKGVAVAFVRLYDGLVLPGVTEIPIPVRFVFLLLGSSSCDLNYMEVGRCMGVLFASSIFRHIAYEARDRRDILVALNEFLDASIVIPHGDWDYDMFHLQGLRARGNSIYEWKFRPSFQSSAESDLEPVPGPNPFVRTGRPFGGAWNDIRRRFPLYWSDITDALNTQCLGVGIFMYFACIAAGCALGLALSEKTDRHIGISENLFGSAIGGIIFALLSCQPLNILATTGSTLVFEESLYQFCISVGLDVEFLAFRFWTAFWMMMFGLIVVAAEVSVLARHFSRFTQEVFALFISIVFIWESFKQAVFDFGALAPNREKTVQQSGRFYIGMALMMGTFTLAMFCRAFKSSSYGTAFLRKLIGNFGVTLAILTLSAFSYISTVYSPLDNLQVPDAIAEGLRTTRNDNVTEIARPGGWIVDPFILSWPWVLASIIPGLLLFFLVFLELSIGELLMDRRECFTRKGSGFHWDALLMCLINLLMGLLGTNYLSPATIRGVTHLLALGVYSTNNPPGEAPHVIATKEQRLTSLAASILLGLSVMMGKVLQYVPTSVLLGFFFYMGWTSLTGLQFADRIYLFFKQVSTHPELAYVKQVRTWKMHMYTLIQILCIVIIWTIKSTKGALILPLTFLVLPFVRKFVLVRCFATTELEALDGHAPAAVVKREPLTVGLSPTPTTLTYPSSDGDLTYGVTPSEHDKTV